MIKKIIFGGVGGEDVIGSGVPKNDAVFQERRAAVSPSGGANGYTARVPEVLGACGAGHLQACVIVCVCVGLESRQAR
jgi:hypothetical protein